MVYSIIQIYAFVYGYNVTNDIIMERSISMEYNDQMKNRVKRIEGQLRGILKMMEDKKDCKDVITQLSATRTAIDRTIGVVVSSNLVECVRQAEESGAKNAEELVKEAVNLLVKSR